MYTTQFEGPELIPTIEISKKQLKIGEYAILDFCVLRRAQSPRKNPIKGY